MLEIKMWRRMKRFYRTYKINGEGEDYLAVVTPEHGETEEAEIESIFEYEYPSREGREICWTSGIFDKLE